MCASMTSYLLSLSSQKLRANFAPVLNIQLPFWIKNKKLKKKNMYKNKKLFFRGHIHLKGWTFLFQILAINTSVFEKQVIEYYVIFCETIYVELFNIYIRGGASKISRKRNFMMEEILSNYIGRNKKNLGREGGVCGWVHRGFQKWVVFEWLMKGFILQICNKYVNKAFSFKTHICFLILHYARDSCAFWGLQWKCHLRHI